jgi:CBS domain-containing protein
MNPVLQAPSSAVELRVDEAMSAPVHTVPASARAREALELMRRTRVQHLVVVDDAGRVVGVLTDGDLRSAQPSVLLVPDASMREKALSLVAVADIMTAQPYTVHCDTPLRFALERMLHTKVGSIPVVDGQGRPAGIVTGFDVLRLAASLLRAH